MVAGLSLHLVFFRGVDVPDSMTDEPLETLPYVEHFYRYLGGQYQVTAVKNVIPILLSSFFTLR